MNSFKTKLSRVIGILSVFATFNCYAILIQNQDKDSNLIVEVCGCQQEGEHPRECVTTDRTDIVLQEAYGDNEEQWSSIRFIPNLEGEHADEKVCITTTYYYKMMEDDKRCMLGPINVDNAANCTLTFYRDGKNEHTPSLVLDKSTAEQCGINANNLVSYDNKKDLQPYQCLEM